jgi:hypothetical protein
MMSLCESQSSICIPMGRPAVGVMGRGAAAAALGVAAAVGTVARIAVSVIRTMILAGIR